MNQGFELIGAGNDSQNPNRQFRQRPVHYSSKFQDIEQFIPQFLHNLQHVVLNSGVQHSEEFGDRLDFDDYGNPILNGTVEPDLKAIYYGGFSLGRGLTQRTHYYVCQEITGDGHRNPNSKMVWYRMRPGEDILDLCRIYMPPILSDTYRELLLKE